MPLYATPVVLPYRLDDGPQPPLYNFQIEAVASSENRAVATAQAMLRATALLHHRAAPLQIYRDRASIGEIRGNVEGPYAYLFTRSDRVPHLTFAPRIEGSACDEFADTLAGLHPGLVYGLVMDLAPLSYTTTRGLSTLVEHGKRLNLHLFRVPEGVRKVIHLTGLEQHLFLHDDIHSAVDGLVQTYRRRLQRQSTRLQQI
jgi:hypothetical protein